MKLEEVIELMSDISDLDRELEIQYKLCNDVLLKNTTTDINPIRETDLLSANLTSDDDLLIITVDLDGKIDYGKIDGVNFNRLGEENATKEFILSVKTKRDLLTLIMIELDSIVAPQLTDDDITSVEIMSYDFKGGTTVELGAKLNNEYTDESYGLYYSTIDLSNFFN